MSSRLRFQIDRIAFFSDAVFAIAMTLMVIEVKPPHLADHFTNKDALWELAKLTPRFLGVIMSFVFIGGFWLRHHEIMKHVENYTSRFMQINLAFLLSIMFMPFSTAFLFENISSLTNTAFVVYNVSYIIATLFNYYLFSYILNPANGIIAPDDPQRMSSYRFLLLYTIGVYCLAIAVSFIYLPFAGVTYGAFGFERFFNKKRKARLATVATVAGQAAQTKE